MDRRDHMELFIPFRERKIQSCRRRAERRNAAYEFNLISVFLQYVLKVAESAVNGRIAEREEHHVFTLVKITFDSPGTF